MNALLDDGVERVVFDCRELSYVGCDGPRGRARHGPGATVQAEGVSPCATWLPHLKDVFRLSDLDEIIPVFDSLRLDAALVMAAHDSGRNRSLIPGVCAEAAIVVHSHVQSTSAEPAIHVNRMQSILRSAARRRAAGKWQGVSPRR